MLAHLKSFFCLKSPIEVFVVVGSTPFRVFIQSFRVVTSWYICAQQDTHFSLFLRVKSQLLLFIRFIPPLLYSGQRLSDLWNSQLLLSAPRLTALQIHIFETQNINLRNTNVQIQFKNINVVQGSTLYFSILSFDQTPYNNLI